MLADIIFVCIAFGVLFCGDLIIILIAFLWYLAFSTSPLSYRIAIDPQGRFLFTPNAGGNSISAYTINQANGALTPVAGSPFAAAIQADGQLVGYSRNTVTGSLTKLPGSPYKPGKLAQIEKFLFDKWGK